MICFVTLAAIFQVLVSPSALGIQYGSTELNLEQLWKQGDYKDALFGFIRTLLYQLFSLMAESILVDKLLLLFVLEQQLNVPVMGSVPQGLTE